jgi:hypothetical protein
LKLYYSHIYIVQHHRLKKKEKINKLEHEFFMELSLSLSQYNNHILIYLKGKTKNST